MIWGEVMLEKTRSIGLQEKAKSLIPGITQLLSKRPDQFAPNVWPGYFSKAHGSEVWDLDGNRYLDMSISGIGANILGYCDPDVDAAVIQAVQSGSSSSLNCPEEVELAELLCELHPWASMARFARTGGESMAIAVRIARAHTRRDKILFCGYHGWHDWYLAANLASDTALDGHLLPGLMPRGVPRALRGTAFPFQYNDLESLRKLLVEHNGEVAAIVMEPVRSMSPLPGFAEGVQDLAKKHQALLIFDEISSGFRLNTGGAHMKFGWKPDIAVFAKAMSNGYPMAALIGTGTVMSSAQDTFVSSTYWTERIGPVAALATIRKHKKENVAEHLIQLGSMIQKGWAKAAQNAGLKVTITGIEPMSYLKFDTAEDPAKSQVIMTFFVQEMIKEGILASNRYYSNFAQTPSMVNRYLETTQSVFQKIKKTIEMGRLEQSLEGGVARPGFHRVN